ncbi:type VI secretion system-associated protein TagF [Mesorhizobium sp. 1M-11]|uniref:type VI secretion system-associated protein TagF n=1 Tax=Mesorhizobium sp. 1M-11 TaxID=1529006 RepID=UPI0006C75644|nr:type VI secretion system-associated protein TagF [Mesorhizobium sp. 1M-11]
MSAPDLNAPGFYGKMPATGDFVTRRLPGDFVRVWDRWLAQHIVPLMASDTWPHSTALRFLAGPASFGVSTGIMLPSADRIGRQFPLSIIARLAEAPLEFVYADAWFEDIEDAAFAAQRGELTPDQLDAALTALPAPSVEPDVEVIDDLVMWTARTDIFDVDPQAPGKTVGRIFAAIGRPADTSN